MPIIKKNDDEFLAFYDKFVKVLNSCQKCLMQYLAKKEIQK